MSSVPNSPYDEKSSLQEIVDQLELCNFTDEVGHSLNRNVAFIELKRRAEQGFDYKGSKDQPDAEDVMTEVKRLRKESIDLKSAINTIGESMQGLRKLL